MEKLHLGCGQVYLDGYTNIDYPMENHSVQLKSIADITTNLLELNYPKSTVDEIRLHHVFEHFSRPVAFSLVASWNSWLKIGGILRIETPNYNKMAWISINPFVSRKKRGVALRHIFGSQEAHWANHFDGYSKEIYEEIFNLLGFKLIDIKFNSWKGTHNIEVFAKKINDLSIDDVLQASNIYLSNYLVDESEGNLLIYWKNLLSEQLTKTFSVK